MIIDEEGRVKVTDFGIARAGASEITQTGSIMGTARYLSPEQAQGQPVSPRSDLYSIGVMLYELLTGTVPFEGDSVVAIALRHLSEPPRPPSSLVPSISPALDAIVLRALAKSPDERFADADEFLAALENERAADPRRLGRAHGRARAGRSSTAARIRRRRATPRPTRRRRSRRSPARTGAPRRRGGIRSSTGAIAAAAAGGCCRPGRSRARAGLAVGADRRARRGRRRRRDRAAARNQLAAASRRRRRRRSRTSSG